MTKTREIRSNLLEAAAHDTDYKWWIVTEIPAVRQGRKNRENKKNNKRGGRR